jgi:hypothetical protein
MPRILDYIVIRRQPIDLGHLERSEFFRFHVDANAVTDSASIPALSFQVRPRSSVVPGPSPDLGAVVDLEIIVNGLPTGVIHITLDSVRGIWRTFSEPRLNSDSSANFVQFTSENGMVRISDVVLWYQRDVEL